MKKPLLARSSGTGPWGKCTGRLQVRMPQFFLEALERFARTGRRTQNGSELARDILCKEMSARIVEAEKNPPSQAEIDADLAVIARLRGVTADEFRQQVIRMAVVGEMAFLKGIVHAPNPKHNGANGA